MSDDENNPLYGDPFQALLDHFAANNIKYGHNREGRRVWFSMNSGSALMKCRFSFSPKGDVLGVFIQYPVLVKEKFRPLAAEFITRANYGLIVGNFEMDMKDGEVRYHISHVMHDGKLEDGTIRRLFSTAMGTSDRYFPALMRVLFAGETPEDAVDLAELDQRADLLEGDSSGSRGKAKEARQSKAPKATGTSSERKPRSKRGGVKTPDIEKPQSDRTTPQLPPLPTPPTIPPAPNAEDRNDDEKGEDHKAV